MAKQKYYYAIVRKDNGHFPYFNSQLPIYFRRDAAKGFMDKWEKDWRKVYTIQKIVCL